MSVQGEKENNGSSGLKGNEGEPGVFNKIVIYELKKKLNSIKVLNSSNLVTNHILEFYTTFKTLLLKIKCFF